MSFLSSLLGLDAKIKSAETDIYNNVYTKKQADGQFVTKTELTAKNYATQDYVSAQNYASKDDVKYSMQNYAYSKSEIDTFLKALNDLSKREEALAGNFYSKADADGRYYTRPDLDTRFQNYYPKPDIDARLSTMYAKADVDSRLAGIYTKADVDSRFAGVYTKGDIDGKLSGVYTKAEIDQFLKDLNARLSK
ncbi:hypothetical protein GGF32_006384 [Allomyces javanicus]|nr:hypothetical protein GGF32_006384 [Allomyces javanicus]